jgi:precorrin-6B methylase 2
LQSLFSKLPPSIAALLLQFSAFILSVLCLRMAGFQATPLATALLCGGLAATLSYLAGQARWWLLIQFLFAPALVLMLSLNIPSGFFLAAFLVMLAVYWSTFRSQVPLYLSSKKVWQALEAQLPPAESGKSFSFMDIGSGMGGVLLHLAAARPDGRYYGVETAPLPWLASWLRIRLGGQRNCTVQWGSMWDCDLSRYDVVFAYLSPVPMEQLWHKVRREMRPGTLFVSNTFAVPEHPPQATITLDDLHHSTLYIWRN